MTTSMAVAVTPRTPRFLYFSIARQAILEPLGVLGDRADLERLLAVDVLRPAIPTRP